MIKQSKVPPMPRVKEASVSNPPTATEWINEYRELKEENERLHRAVQNYDDANVKISLELNETRLRLAKAEARIEELTRVNVETVVVDNEESRIPIVVSLEKY